MPAREAGDRVSFAHTVSGGVWLARFVGCPEKIAVLEDAVRLQLAGYCQDKGIELVGPPTLHRRYDEQHGFVTIYAEGIAR